MTLNKKIFYSYVFLFMLIGIFSVLILHRTTQHRVQQSQETIIDGFAHQASLIEYNEQGDIQTVISAKRAIHFQKNGTTHFNKPFIMTYAQDRTPWHIRADQGVSDKNGQQLILQHNIIIHELPTANHPETRITTNELTIFPKDSRALTHRAVTLSRPGMVIHGVGLTANFKTGEYQLQSQSKAIYQPWKHNGN